jgi:molybdopterin/thiamine biosynthesis adenylyltransferase/rhodanese-related sulfurtransferase
MQAGRSYERYHRQIILKGFGMEAQQKLSDARVLVIGAGGLGCPVLMTLTGAGVGQIGIADDGTVELSNLHRQFLYNTNDLDKRKVDCAEKFLQAMNPDVAITAFPIRLTNSNVLAIMKNYDVVIDGTDNFQSRYMLNDACALLGKPLIYGAVSRFEGQVAVFNSHSTYRDIFPNPPKDGETDNCSEAGVLGVLPNIIGNLMANECIKLLTGTGESLTGKLLTYSANVNRVFIVDIPPTAEGFRLLPKSVIGFEKMDYPTLCGVIAGGALDVEISIDEFNDLLAKEDVTVIDVRELDELPELTNITYQRIPLSLLESHKKLLNGTVVFVCQSGKRSLKAAALFGDAEGLKVYSLKGGVNALLLNGIFI